MFSRSRGEAPIASHRFAVLGTALVLVTALVTGAAVGLNSSAPATLGPAKDVPVTVAGIGSVEADRVANIGFDIGGVIAAINAKVNERVAAGAVVAVLDRSRQEAELRRARSQLTAAEARVAQIEAQVQSRAGTLELRRRSSARNRKLLKSGAASLSDAEDMQLTQEIAAANLASTRRSLDAAKARFAEAQAGVNLHAITLDKHVLRAPFDAIIAEKMHEAGEAIAAGAGVFTLVDPASVWVLAYVDEARAGAIRAGQSAEIRLRSRPHEPMTGRVARINVENDRVTEERRVYVAFDRIPPDYNLGEQAEVWIETGRVGNATLIPQRLVLEDGRNTGLIWTLDHGDQTRRRVDLGRRLADGRIELVSPLPEGVSVLAEEPPEPWYTVLGFGGERL